VAVTPDGATAYVANHGGNTVSVIDTATNTVTTTITVGSFPHQVAVTPDGTTAYTGNDGSGSVSVIDTTTNTVTTTITVGTGPTGVAVTPAPATTGSSGSTGTKEKPEPPKPVCTPTAFGGTTCYETSAHEAVCSPDGQFMDLLFGQWTLNPDAYTGYYRAVYVKGMGLTCNAAGYTYTGTQVNENGEDLGPDDPGRIYNYFT
jgi:YVTN family beta-propeller protein